MNSENASLYYYTDCYFYANCPYMIVFESIGAWQISHMIWFVVLIVLDKSSAKSSS